MYPSWMVALYSEKRDVYMFHIFQVCELELYDVKTPDKVPILREGRAYTSPIWYTPE